jgi:hypothetical protein
MLNMLFDSCPTLRLLLRRWLLLLLLQLLRLLQVLRQLHQEL